MNDRCDINDRWSVSYGYQQGCRCDSCTAWRRAKDLQHREANNAYRRRVRGGRSAPVRSTAEVKTSGRSATTLYNDILDWWDGL